MKTKTKDNMSKKESTEERISEAMKLIIGAREDIKNHWSGNSDAREDADQQLSVALGFLGQSEDEQLSDAILNARTTIGTFFNDLQTITNQSYGNVGEQLQAGEGNLSR